MDKVVLALDLGGTNARFAAVLPDGSILTRMRVRTPKTEDGDQILGMIVNSFQTIRKEVGDKYEAVAIAAAVPAVIRAADGILSGLPNLPALEGVDIGGALRDGLGLKTYLENDATAATIGEHWIGVSKGIDNVIGVTLGTGVGGGLIFNGSPFRGKDGTAGEIGHVCVEPEGHPCGCGSRGCVEQYASGTAIIRMAREAGLEAASSWDVYELAINGDEKAAAVFSKMGKYLGIVFAGLVNVLNPEMIVIGGGVSGGWDLFIHRVEREVIERAFRDPARRAKIVRAGLGEDAGILGAARVAFDLMA